ncbi:MAG: arginine--tRNA ligase, partial [Candidatus Aminicenantes bacterium]|nr:arginine--tRNA ligase [Candidatus Aminicenantes bacterium]
AHARICSLMRMAEREIGFEVDSAIGERLASLAEPVELELSLALLDFSDVIQSCLRFLEPQKMVEYLHGIAELYHKFYQECSILKAPEELRTARLELSLCVRQVLRNGFSILGISSTPRSGGSDRPEAGLYH